MCLKNDFFTVSHATQWSDFFDRGIKHHQQKKKGRTSLYWFFFPNFFREGLLRNPRRGTLFWLLVLCTACCPQKERFRFRSRPSGSASFAAGPCSVPCTNASDGMVIFCFLSFCLFVPFCWTAVFLAAAKGVGIGLGEENWWQKTSGHKGGFFLFYGRIPDKGKKVWFANQFGGAA